MKLNDITLSKANAIWRKAATFDEKVYEIMQYIIEKEDTRILINRNPTLIKNLVSLNPSNCWELLRA